MIFFLSLLLVGVISERLSNICLPNVHEAHVGTRANAWSDTRMSHHHDEYYEGDHLHVWFDGTKQKTLVHMYEEDWYNHKGETHHYFGLRDYKRQLHWHGHWNHTLKQVTNCQLELFNRPFAVYCLTPPGRQANLTDSGYVGMSTAVDFWSVRFDDHERKFFEDIHMILEKGSTSIVMQERVFGEHFNETEQKLWKWVEHREWFDVKEDPIPDSVFAIPQGCPGFVAN